MVRVHPRLIRLTWFAVAASAAASVAASVAYCGVWRTYGAYATCPCDFCIWLQA